jgi:hypothetical protein
MPSLDKLVGSQKTVSDIRSVPFRHRYLNAQTVGPSVSNGPIRFTLPRVNAGMLDVSTLRFRGLLNVVTSDPTARLAGHDASILFDRIRVTNGSTVILDIEHNSLISNFTNGLMTPTDVDYQNYERALSDYPQDTARTSQVTTAHTNNRIVIGKLGPKDSFLNQKALIPLEMINSPLHIDLYFSDPAVCFLSTDSSLTYSFDSLELNWDALYSASLNAHYSGSPVSHHATMYGHRYNFIPTASSTVNLAIPSNSSNVSGILTFLRDQTNHVSDITQNKLENCNFHATGIEEVDFKIATKSIYDEKLGPDINEYYEQFHHLFPTVSTSRHYTPDGFTGNQFILATNLSGSPRQFHDELVSGVQSANLNTDMHLQIKFASPSPNLQCDHWVLSDVVYTFNRGRIDVSY